MICTHSYAWPESVEPITDRRNANTPANIRANTKYAASESNQSAFATCASTCCQTSITRIQRPAKDIVIAVASHNRLGNIRLAVEYSS